MPHDGHGKPVAIFKGHNDCSFSKELLVFCNPNKKGITSTAKAPDIPIILFSTNFLISTVCLFPFEQSLQLSLERKILKPITKLNRLFVVD